MSYSFLVNFITKPIKKLGSVAKLKLYAHLYNIDHKMHKILHTSYSLNFLNIIKQCNITIK